MRARSREALLRQQGKGVVRLTVLGRGGERRPRSLPRFARAGKGRKTRPERAIRGRGLRGGGRQAKGPPRGRRTSATTSTIFYRKKSVINSLKRGKRSDEAGARSPNLGPYLLPMLKKISRMAARRTRQRERGQLDVGALRVSRPRSERPRRGALALLTGSQHDEEEEGQDNWADGERVLLRFARDVPLVDVGAVLCALGGGITL